MTMVPAQNLSKQQQQQHHLYGGGAYAGGCGGGYTESFGLMNRIEGYEYCSESFVGSDLVVGPMAEDESRTNSLNEAGSSSKDVQEERDVGWLRLSIGGHSATHNNKHHDDQADPTATRNDAGLIELDLLPGGTGGSQQPRPFPPIFHHVPEFRAPPRAVASHPTSFSTSLFFQHQAAGSSSNLPHQEINWAFRPIPHNIAGAAASSPTSLSSSSSLMMPTLGSYFPRPFQPHAGIELAGPSLDFRVIDPPRRPHSGIWFMLQASQNQAKEPFLQQITKSYLRIKDGRMTVRLLMKYLVRKLGLDSESEVFKAITPTSFSLENALKYIYKLIGSIHVVLIYYYSFFI